LESSKSRAGTKALISIVAKVFKGMTPRSLSALYTHCVTKIRPECLPDAAHPICLDCGVIFG
jgi:hypothetical protein